MTPESPTVPVPTDRRVRLLASLRPDPAAALAVGLLAAFLAALVAAAGGPALSTLVGVAAAAIAVVAIFALPALFVSLAVALLEASA